VIFRLPKGALKRVADVYPRESPLEMRFWSLLLMLVLLAGCDPVLVDDGDILVVEMFAQSEREYPQVRVSIPGDLSSRNPDGAPLLDATVAVEIGTREVIRYVADGERPGTYRPVQSGRMRAGEQFTLRVDREGQRARATSVLPPHFQLDSLTLTPSVMPVRAALLDSLQLDSLTIRQGWVYTVQVEAWWNAAPQPRNTFLHVRVQAPQFSSVLVDLFLPKDRIEPETGLQRESGNGYWSGLYAVAVNTEADLLPMHQVRLGFVRGGLEYARYMASRDQPLRREPVSNVTGGRGIVAGISLDTLTLSLPSHLNGPYRCTREVGWRCR